MMSLKKKAFIAIIIIILLVSSLPTFLNSNSRISYLPTYADEVSAGRFLATLYGTGKNLNFYSTTWSDSFSSIYTYYAGRGEEGDSAYHNVTAYWQRINTLVNIFETKHGFSDSTNLFVVSLKFNMNAQHLLGITPRDENWTRVVSLLSQNNIVYNNQNVVLYSP
jgi:hypothetical protein